MRYIPDIFSKTFGLSLRHAAPRVVVPKVESVDDLKLVIATIELFERELSRAQPLDVHAMLESASGIRKAFDIGGCDERVKSLMTGTIPDGDVARSVGFTPTRSGLETLFLLSFVQLEGRAAGCAAMRWSRRR